MLNEGNMTQQQRSQVRTTQREPGLEQRLYTFKAMQLIWLGLGILEALIGLRVIFKLMAVNPDNILASLLYGVTSLFLFPFAGLTPTPASGGMVLEISSLIAMVVYALLAWAVVKLVEVIFYRPREAVVNVTESMSSEEHTP
jgi:uncharacterized membrane protein